MNIHDYPHCVRRAVLAGALMLSVSGCYTTRIHSGVPGTMLSPMANERWHHTLIAGLAEVSDPVDLDGVCPPGAWGTISEELSFLNGLVGAVTWQIYAPRTYTITCGGAGAPPPGWGAPGAPPPPNWGAPPPGAPMAPPPPPAP